MKIINNWVHGLIYPFKEKDWYSKMWLIPLLGVFLTPFLELLILRGWRVELVRRIGLKEDRILPKADFGAVITYALHGIKLWSITAVYIIVPIIFFRLIGISPYGTMIVEIRNIIGYFWDSFWGVDIGMPLMTAVFNSVEVVIKEFFYKNLWLLFYYPYYRTATIRYALIGKFRKSHLAFLPNILFIGRNIKHLALMVINQIIDKTLLFFLNLMINILLTPIIGALIAPMFLFYADFWTSGYEYGEIAERMAEQEYPQLINKNEVNSFSEEEVMEL